MKPIKSFCQYVEKIKEYNDVVPVIKEVDWNLEISAVTRRAYELSAPAMLFKNIKGCIPGFEVLGVWGWYGKPALRQAFRMC